MEMPSEIRDWKKTSELGSGAFGTVMLWKNDNTNEFIAIKKCKFLKPSALSTKQKERWHKEVEFIQSVDHPNIIKFKKLPLELEVFLNKYNPSKLPLLSMEYCRKGNLRKYLTSEPLKLCGLMEDDVKCILNDISNGLKYLHNKNITHRDLKPENIVLQHCDNRKGQIIYIIIDLGYAKELQDSTLSFVGTLQYLAPEIFCCKSYTKSVDYWSMGLIAFEIACGILPFLPELGPFERYEKIRNKSSDDICIFMSYAGVVTTSKHIKKENFLTSYLKESLEIWLKNILQFDAPSRIKIDEIESLDYLNSFLNTKVIKVFSVYNYEFYSYKFSDCKPCTLKSLISRDIEVPEEELFFLFTDKNCDNESNIICTIDKLNIIKHLLREEHCMIYVFRKGFELQKPKHDLPKLIRETFNVSQTFNVKFIKALYREALFFIYKQCQIEIELEKAFTLLIDHIKQIESSLLINNTKISDIFKTVLAKINVHDRNKFITSSSSNKLELFQCLKCYERLLSNLERRDKNLRTFRRETQILKTCVEDSRNGIENIFQTSKFIDRLNQINCKKILERKPGGDYTKDFLERINEVVNSTLKLKYCIFEKDKYIQNYTT